ncbi:hypothetical protein [Desulfosporosinus acidiphilus]|uniref:hypothetical protein n=1 Tax=Desulfosporosinus acidiphilus TaxID=885581 RepID=UPI0011D25F06|nr:hypothetical protein [Desulfosporosinus acidiphilus]
MRQQGTMPSLAYPALGTSCAVVPGAMAAAHVRRPWMAECPRSHGWREGTYAQPRIWGQSLSRSLLGCLRKRRHAVVILRPNLGSGERGGT